MKHIKTPLRKIACSLMVGTFLAGSAYAAPTLQVREISTSTGAQSGSLQLPVNPSGPQNYFAGFQNIEVQWGSNPSNTFQALCIDPAQYSSTSFSYYDAPNPATFFTSLGATKAAQITTLFNHGFAGTAGNNQNAAAFQLALWEIANDDGNLNTGLVQVNTNTAGWLVSGAQALLTAQSTPSAPSLYNFTIYQSQAKQDFIVATPVPEPGTYAMFLAGLGLMAVIARRRSAS